MSLWTFLSMQYWHKILHLYLFILTDMLIFFLRMKHFLESQMKSIVLGFLTHRSGDVWETFGSWSGKASLSIRCNWKHMGLNRNSKCRRCVEVYAFLWTKWCLVLLQGLKALYEILGLTILSCKIFTQYKFNCSCLFQLSVLSPLILT